jgi:ketosteroid isomerase-like protein
MYRQDYVVFLRAADGKIAFLREYFDPVRAAWSDWPCQILRKGRPR